MLVFIAVLVDRLWRDFGQVHEFVRLHLLLSATIVYHTKRQDGWRCTARFCPGFAGHVLLCTLPAPKDGEIATRLSQIVNAHGKS